MAASILTPLLFNAGATLAGSLFKGLTGQTKFQGTNPAEYKDKLTLSNADIAQTENDLFSRLDRNEAKRIMDIKQAGAAGGLPKAATQVAIADAGTATARGARGIKSDLKRQQRDSYARYLGLLRNYEGQKLAYDTQNNNASAAFLQGGLGNIGNILTLYAGGYFDKPQ